jgi:hypothetical protein
MKEVAAPGNNRNRQCLRARPVQHGRKQHGVVLLAVHNQGFEVGGFVNRRGRRAGDAGADQHQLFDVAARTQALEGVRGDEGAEGKPGQRQRLPGARGAACSTTASKSSSSPRPSSWLPALPPTPRKLKRTAVQPHCTKARASVCTTLLSMVPANSGCGCAMTATPRESPAGRSSAISSAPAGPSMMDLRVWAFTTRALSFLEICGELLSIYRGVSAKGSRGQRPGANAPDAAASAAARPPCRF